MKSSKTISASVEETSRSWSGAWHRWFDFDLIRFQRTADDRANLGLGMLSIVALVFIIYSPILPGNFLMDDHRLIQEDNPLTNGQFEPHNIWFQTDFTLSTLGLWLQWLAWGEHPGWYHVVNMALHAFSAILLWRLLAKLEIPGAWLAAVLFAVHPVCVNSVARIAEIKNTLSLPFFLLSFWLYLQYESRVLGTFRRTATAPDRWGDSAALWYGLSLIAFVLALLSKTSTVMLPVVLLGCALWQRGRITRREILQTSPYFILALAFGLMSVWFQKHQALASIGATLPPESFLEKLTVAGRMIWFYLGKAVLPVHLNIVYPRWQFGVTVLILPALLLLAGFAVCWKFRRGWGRHALFGLGCFIATLFPALGFFDSQFLTMWQVSDHLQYLPLIAVVTLMAAGFAFLFKNAEVFNWIALALVLTLATLSFQRAQVFSTQDGLCLDSLQKNPAAAFMHNELGIVLAKRQKFAEAAIQFACAVQSDPGYGDARLNLGQALTLNGRFAEGEPQYLTAIRLKPNDAQAHKLFGHALSEQGRNQEAIFHLQMALSLGAKPEVQTRLALAALLYQTGKPRLAADQFRKVLVRNPDSLEPLNNLAWLLATCSESTVRDGAEALRHARRGCQLTAFKDAKLISTLAAACAEAGLYSEAVTNAETAVRLQTANGETHLANINNQLLPLYRSGMPYHDPPVACSSP